MLLKLFSYSVSAEIIDIDEHKIFDTFEFIVVEAVEVKIK